MKAVFIDRDGVINELVYYEEHGIIDSPFTATQFRLHDGAGEAINRLRRAGYLAVLVSNQPGMAKGHFTEATFERIRRRMRAELAKRSAFLDGEYYCFHHPEARIAALRGYCECRKPKPGMLLQAAQELGINLARSWMIGDGLTDIAAGQAAGTKTILIGRMKCELCPMMEATGSGPDFICASLLEASERIIKEQEISPVRHGARAAISATDSINQKP